MKVLLVRHADAMSSAAGGDLARPLNEKGRTKSHAVGKRLAALYGSVSKVYASPALRARETAEILAEEIGAAQVDETDLLQPGSTADTVRKLLAASGPDDVVLLVGHEPDFSRIISGLTANGQLFVNVSKLTCAELEIDKDGTAVLMSLLPYSAMGSD